MNIKAIEGSFRRDVFAPVGLGRRLELGRQRRALARLNPLLLADVGISPAEAQAESRRKIWDAPAHWRL